jgi:hypothetical protein
LERNNEKGGVMVVVMMSQMMMVSPPKIREGSVPSYLGGVLSLGLGFSRVLNSKKHK